MAKPAGQDFFTLKMILAVLGPKTIYRGSHNQLILSSKVNNICMTCSVLTLAFLCIPAKVCLKIEKNPEAFEKIGTNGANISSLSKLILSHTDNILKFIPINFKVI